MVTRRGFIAKASAACAALVGLALSQKYDEPATASGQGREPAPPVIKPQPAGGSDRHRVEAKVSTVKPQPWTVRTFRYRATRDLTLFEGDVLTDHLLRRKGLVPVDDSMPFDAVLNMPRRLQLRVNDTVSFSLNRSALDIIRNRFTPDVWDSPFDGGEVALWMVSE
jgi:hypothetical protein